MSLPARVLRYTPAEYLELERRAEFRHEYFSGEIFAMAGGTALHSLIKTNVTSELRTQLKGKPCATYDSDLRIKVAATGLYTYPDASVICGALEFDDERRDTVLNPTVLVEVLSPSTEAYDRGKKFDHFRQIPTLREYVLIVSTSAQVERFARNADDSWTLTVVSGLDAVVTLPSIGATLRLAEIYDRVDYTQAEQ